MHPALHSWREELPDAVVRVLAYLGAAAVLSIAATYLFQPPATGIPDAPVVRSPWVEIERPFPAFNLSIPEAADMPSSYAIRRHVVGHGRKDILGLGEPDGTGPYLQVEVYRPGTEVNFLGDPRADIAASAAALGPVAIVQSAEPLESKFGPLTIVTFDTTKGVTRRCLAFVRAFDDPALQISGWFCQGGPDLIARSTLACALDRLTLLAAGSEPKVGALFAQAELIRSYCGQRSPLMAPTPKHRALWNAAAGR
ncbi:MAG: hypothetical protein Q8M26_13675 [Pseudolabrys sp.]|nr:hypothetical protein [Pseudolabrys sp.]